MNFVAVPSGESLFIDANVFIYAFGPEPSFGPPSMDLLQRVEQNDVDGYISSHVLHDVAHRLMTLEACQTFGWPYSGIGQRLRRHPSEIQKLHKFRQALDEILAIGVQILPVSADDVILAGDLSCVHGLLSGDALILAVMHRCSLTHIASSDADFDRVSGITRYGPL
jgi:predicted nucleic acid-binding protein